MNTFAKKLKQLNEECQENFEKLDCNDINLKYKNIRSKALKLLNKAKNNLVV